MDLYIKNGAKNKNILIAHDGVDLSNFDINLSKDELRENLELPKNKKIISYVGKYKTMGEGKGIDELIHVFPEILKTIPDAFLLLVGVNQGEVADVEKIFNSSKDIISNVRKKHKPFLIEADTYRWKGHVSPSEDCGVRYRERCEIEQWKNRCPLKKFTKSVLAKKLLTQNQFYLKT